MGPCCGTEILAVGGEYGLTVRSQQQLQSDQLDPFLPRRTVFTWKTKWSAVVNPWVLFMPPLK